MRVLLAPREIDRVTESTVVGGMPPMSIVSCPASEDQPVGTRRDPRTDDADATGVPSGVEVGKQVVTC